MTTPSPADRFDAAALAPGARVEEYEVLRVLGGGGFGITYLARDAHLDLQVALKEYFPADLLARGPDGAVAPRTGDPEARQRFAAGLQRFVEEARALAAFRHPNIVRVLRYFGAQGTAYIVMEYESGQSLRQWLPRQPPLTRAALLALIGPLLDGLEAVHAAGFLHRDIKPDNVYVRADGSPVLLDFGAARRVLADGDLTNVVSPGFAPFEQYHSRGVQGPWTDLYALGAVMYWMATGRKPLEAAARIETDPMVPAAQAGDPMIFGAPVLQAIDWALQPDARRRPQSVAQLRAALADEAGHPAPAPAGSGHSLGSLRHRTLLCTILFLDLVGYSACSVDDQVALKKRLNDLIARAIAPVPADSRLAVDTGDGAAICFLEDPAQALEAAMLLRDLLARRFGRSLPARIGLHVGPVRLVSDVNGRVNVVGDGINMAQRVMDFARPGEVLASRAFHEVASRISDDAAGLFRYLGRRHDKHGRAHDLHAVLRAPGLAAREGGAEGAFRGPSGDGPLAETEVQEISADLARRIGPMARVLVARARRRATSAQALRDALAPLIPEHGARVAFRQAGDRVTHAATHPSASRRDHSGSRSRPSGRPARTGAAPPPAQALQALEQALGRQIGPMARLLLRQAVESGTSPDEFVAALSGHIRDPGQRATFRLLARQLLARGGHDT